MSSVKAAEKGSFTNQWRFFLWRRCFVNDDGMQTALFSGLKQCCLTGFPHGIDFNGTNLSWFNAHRPQSILLLTLWKREALCHLCGRMKRIVRFFQWRTNARRQHGVVEPFCSCLMHHLHACSLRNGCGPVCSFSSSMTGHTQPFWLWCVLEYASTDKRPYQLRSFVW